MPKTHTFARHTGGDPVIVVLDKIESLEHDDISLCTNITTVGGQIIAVAESLEDVRRIIENG